MIKLVVFFLAILLSATIIYPAAAQVGILDNSFLIEEAYNQESGIVQHILNLIFSSGISCILFVYHYIKIVTRTDITIIPISIQLATICDKILNYNFFGWVSITNDQ